MPRSTMSNVASASERRNLTGLPQGDSPRDLLAQEILHNPSLRNSRVEAPGARARAPAPQRGPPRGVVATGCSERRKRFARQSIQCKKHGRAAQTPWALSGRVRTADRGIGTVRLQLGRGQGSPSRPAPCQRSMRYGPSVGAKQIRSSKHAKPRRHWHAASCERLGLPGGQSFLTPTAADACRRLKGFPGGAGQQQAT